MNAIEACAVFAEHGIKTSAQKIREGVRNGTLPIGYVSGKQVQIVPEKVNAYLSGKPAESGTRPKAEMSRMEALQMLERLQSRIAQMPPDMRIRAASISASGCEVVACD